MSLRVVLADDHAILRDGLATVLRDAGIDVVGEAADGEAALALIERLRPDVAVVDIEMPGMTGIEVARKARDAGLQTAVVILSMHRRRYLVRESIDAGASGFVVKEAAAADLLESVRVAAAGSLYLSPSIARFALSGRERNEPLTPREREVLRLVALGLSSKEIAEKLQVTRGTVDNYRAAIMDKLGVRHIPGLVKYAILLGIARLDE
jgi:DNA-binding NarL/FixJ family response regulator